MYLEKMIQKVGHGLLVSQFILRAGKYKFLIVISYMTLMAPNISEYNSWVNVFCNIFRK